MLPVAVFVCLWPSWPSRSYTTNRTAALFKCEHLSATWLRIELDDVVVGGAILPGPILSNVIAQVITGIILRFSFLPVCEPRKVHVCNNVIYNLKSSVSFRLTFQSRVSFCSGHFVSRTHLHSQFECRKNVINLTKRK